tara:strand:- start:1191 stop:1931 length:741 start_codon:yes stop_codon:yes gene_type:complete
MSSKRPFRILIVEDDMIIAANLSLQLTSLGCEVIGIESRGEEAISHVKANAPDILLMDINLKGEMNGIEAVTAIQQFVDIPIVYLTANNDDATFAMAKKTQPKAYISKPFNKLNLERTLELVMEQIKDSNLGKPVANQVFEVLGDRFFVRHHGKLEKLLLEDILFIEADRNYSTIVTNTGKHILTSTLKTMEERLPAANFIRVHRSYMVNLSKLDVVSEHHLEIGRKVIPLGKSHKELLLRRIQTI